MGTYHNIQAPYHVPLVAPGAPIPLCALSHGLTAVCAYVQTTDSSQTVLKPSCPANLSWQGSYRPSCGYILRTGIEFACPALFEKPAIVFQDYRQAGDV